MATTRFSVGPETGETGPRGILPRLGYRLNGIRASCNHHARDWYPETSRKPQATRTFARPTFVDYVGSGDILAPGKQGESMTTFRSSALALALLLGGGHVAAQAQDEGQTEGEDQAPEPTSGADQLAKAKGIQANGEALAARLQTMLKAARDSGDIVKVTYLNDKLTQSNANLRTVKQRVEALDRAVAVSDEAAAKHEYTVLSVLSQKFQTLGQEASQCVGQDMYEPGASQVVTEVAPGTTTVDPANVGSVNPSVTPPDSPSVTVPPPSSAVL